MEMKKKLKKREKTLSPLPLEGGEPVRGRKSPFKGDLEGLHSSLRKYLELISYSK